MVLNKDKMPADKQYADANRAVDTIERKVLSRGKRLTYGRLAELLGYDASKYARHIGQVCSLIDSACYWSKLPMLSLEKIRMDSGEHNPDSCAGVFHAIKDRLVENAEAREWSSDDIKHIKHSLDHHMNGDSALLQWKRIESFGQAGLDRLASYK